MFLIRFSILLSMISWVLPGTKSQGQSGSENAKRNGNSKPEEVIADMLMVNDVHAESSKLPIAFLEPRLRQVRTSPENLL